MRAEGATVSEQQTPSHVKPEERPQRSLLDRALGCYPEGYLAQEETAEGADSAHEHLYRVALGNNGLVLRWCERCGKAFLLEQVHELVQKTTTYKWIVIHEAEEQ
jgi:hypothetical protein